MLCVCCGCFHTAMASFNSSRYHLAHKRKMLIGSFTESFLTSRPGRSKSINLQAAVNESFLSARKLVFPQRLIVTTHYNKGDAIQEIGTNLKGPLSQVQ